MKKIMIIAVAACSFSAVKAQVITVPKGPITKVPRSVVFLTPTVVINRTSGNYPDVSMRVDVSVEDAGEQGYRVNFQSSIPIETVEIKRAEPKQDLNTLTLAAGQSAGYFFMDAPVYKGSNTYILQFYAPGNAKPIWTSMVQRKKS